MSVTALKNIVKLGNPVGGIFDHTISLFDSF